MDTLGTGQNMISGQGFIASLSSPEEDWNGLRLCLHGTHLKPFWQRDAQEDPIDTQCAW